jgi:hypothetical protein
VEHHSLLEPRTQEEDQEIQSLLANIRLSYQHTNPTYSTYRTTYGEGTLKYV